MCAFYFNSGNSSFDTFFMHGLYVSMYNTHGNGIEKKEHFDTFLLGEFFFCPTKCFWIACFSNEHGKMWEPFILYCLDARIGFKFWYILDVCKTIYRHIYRLQSDPKLHADCTSFPSDFVKTQVKMYLTIQTILLYTTRRLIFFMVNFPNEYHFISTI